MYPTIKDYLNTQIHKWPILFAKDTYERSELKALDQLLNTIGNGITDDEELLEEISKTKPYRDCKFIGQTIWSPSSTNARNYPNLYCLEHEKVNYPKINYWIKYDSKKYNFELYPNFTKRYSTIYECPVFLKLGDDWLLKAIWFYEECYKWFIKNEANYLYAFPRNNLRETTQFLNEMDEIFNGYIDHDTITRNYKIEYMGDTYDFLVRSWCKEKVEIYKFIKDTIRLLKRNLKTNQ